MNSLSATFYSSSNLTLFRSFPTRAAVCGGNRTVRVLSLQYELKEDRLVSFFMTVLCSFKGAQKGKTGCISQNFAKFEISASKNPTHGNHRACLISRHRFAVFCIPAILSYFFILDFLSFVCIFLESISALKKTASKKFEMKHFL